MFKRKTRFSPLANQLLPETFHFTDRKLTSETGSRESSGSGFYDLQLDSAASRCLPGDLLTFLSSSRRKREEQLVVLESGKAGSRPSFASDWLCDLRQIPHPLCSLVSSLVK